MKMLDHQGVVNRTDSRFECFYHSNKIWHKLYATAADGKMSLYPVEDEPNVNKRRKKVGLDSLEVYARKLGVQYTVPRKDSYKGKIVVYGEIADKEQKPLVGAKVYMGKRLLAKTNASGDYAVVIDKQNAANGLTFKLQGYNDVTFPLTENKDVYMFVFLLDKN